MSWPMVAIKDVAKVVTGKTPSTVDSDNFGGDIPFITPSELGLGAYVTASPRTLSDKGAAEIKLVPKNAVMVCCIGSLGKLAIAGTAVATNQQINSVIFDENKVDTKYGFYALQLLKPKMESMAPSTTVAIINKSNFEALQIPLPPLPVQKRIAAILDKADAIRRKRKQAIQLADDFLRAVFLDMFGDPVTNPKGWVTFTLRELIHLQGGFAFKSDDFSDAGIPVVKIGNANKVGFTTKDISFIQPENPGKLVQYELYPGDLLMSLTGTVGKDDYANVSEVTDDYERYYLNQRVAKISIRSERITKNYLRFFLAHPKIKSEITKTSRGVRQANISNGDIYELHTPLPEHDALVKFDHVIERLNSAAKALSQCSRSDGALFHSLSQKAFSGQL